MPPGDVEVYPHLISINIYKLKRLPANGYQPFLITLSYHPQKTHIKVHIRDFEFNQFCYPGGQEL